VRRSLALAVSCFALLAAAPAAAADGPLFVTQGGEGIAQGPTRYIPIGDYASGTTELLAVSTKDGTEENQLGLVGQWGLPSTPAGADGLSRDGRSLVLADARVGLVSPSRFLIVNPRSMRVVNHVELTGYFTFDALSPDASRLYLIQYTRGSSNDTSHYVVRGYDLDTNRLLPGRIADRTQKSWVMEGYPVTRAWSPDGRWVYTLYENPGGYPFVHALDTVRGVAHCVGLPWEGPNQNALWNVVLDVRDGGRTLAVHWRSGRPWLDVANGTWRISYPSAGFPWRWLAAGLGSCVALLAAAALLIRRRRGHIHERPAEELGLA
jgi:hypothetical protein